jgi:chromosome segregation ATPase
MEAIVMDVDQALWVAEHLSPAQSGHAAEVLAAEVRRLQGQVASHEAELARDQVALKALIAENDRLRARDEAFEAEVRRLRVERDRIHEAYGAMRMRARQLAQESLDPTDQAIAQAILGDEPEVGS